MDSKRYQRHLAKAKEWTLGTLKRKTAKALQKAIRMERADRKGDCTCVTCGARGYWKTFHAGHFISGRSNGVLFDERGIHPQCVRCNNYLSGNQEAYTRFMLERYGRGVVDELRQARNTTVTLTREELVEMRIGYLDRIKEAEGSVE